MLCCTTLSTEIKPVKLQNALLYNTFDRNQARQASECFVLQHFRWKSNLSSFKVICCTTLSVEIKPVKLQNVLFYNTFDGNQTRQVSKCCVLQHFRWKSKPSSFKVVCFATISMEIKAAKLQHALFYNTFDGNQSRQASKCFVLYHFSIIEKRACNFHCIMLPIITCE